MEAKSLVCARSSCAAILFGLTACAAFADITTGLVVQYAFEGNTNDSSGNGYNGTAANVTYAPGRIGQAASFDDASSAITTASLAGQLPAGSSSRTVAFWMNSSSTASNGNMVSWGARVGNQRFSALQENGGELRMIGEGSDYGSGTNLGSNTWHHVALTYTASSLIFYVDGVQVSSSVVAPQLNTSAANGLRIGVNALPANDEYFGGLLDEVRVYNRVLSPADVAELYAYNGLQAPAAVPTLSEWATMLLGLMLAASGFLLRRRIV